MDNITVRINEHENQYEELNLREYLEVLADSVNTWTHINTTAPAIYQFIQYFVINSLQSSNNDDWDVFKEVVDQVILQAMRNQIHQEAEEARKKREETPIEELKKAAKERDEIIRQREAETIKNILINYVEDWDGFEEETPPQIYQGGYSGRNMFGKKCFAITMPGNTNILELGACIMSYAIENTDNEDDRAALLWHLNQAEIDNLGQDIIVYFPRIEE